MLNLILTLDVEFMKEYEFHHPYLRYRSKSNVNILL